MKILHHKHFCYFWRVLSSKGPQHEQNKPWPNLLLISRKWNFDKPSILSTTNTSGELYFDFISCKSMEGPSINNWERSNWEILVKWINHFWVCVFIWSLQILHDHRLNRSDRTQFYPSDQGRLRESSRSSGSFAIVRVEFPYDRPDRLDIREF